MAPLSAPGQSRPRGILGAMIVFTVLPPFFVILRFWARKLKNTPLALNDYLIIIAVLFTIGLDIDVIYCIVHGGTGQHIIRLSLEESVVLQKGFFAATTLWPSANTFVKLSILEFYYRTFPNRQFRTIVWILVSATIAYGFSTIVTAFTICRPLAYNWNKAILDGRCGNISAYYLSTGIVNFIVDIGIVSLPMPMLWGLQMRTSRKIALTFIFGMGYFICIITILRIVEIRRLDYSDVSYNIVLDTMWTVLEPTLGVISASLPMLQPVVSKASSSSLFSYVRRGGSTKNSSKNGFWSGSSSNKVGKGDDSKPKNFVRIGENHSLTELCLPYDGITISAREGGAESVNTTETNSRTEAKEAIRVKKGWDVQSVGSRK